MKDFLIKKDSWHYRFLSWYVTTRDVYNSKGWHDEDEIGHPNYDAVKVYDKYYSKVWNFCQYWRMVLLFPALRFFFNLLPYVAVIVVSSYVGLGSFTFSIIGLIIFLVALAIAVSIIIGVGIGAGVVINKVGKVTTAAQRTSLFISIYTAYKNKLCPAVEYEKNVK